jgi:polyhydroxybutyrate depolymerase
MLRSLALLALLLPSLASAVLVPGDNDRTIQVDGLTRQYRVHVPPGWTPGTQAPVVFDVHGWSTTAALQQSLSGLQAVSDREGFLVVWPQGLNNQWNAGICCGNPGLDDVAFFRAAVDAVLAEAGADRRRVYITGLSNGGAMSHKLACEASDVFAAAAPLAFPLPYPSLTDCAPARPMPILMTMGLTDALVKYENGEFGSAPATFARWRDLHGCTGTPTLVPHGQSRCETFEAAQCASGYPVGLCSVVAQEFPGQFFSGHILYLNPDLNLAEEVWAFLSRFTLPAGFTTEPLRLEGTARLRFGDRRTKPTGVAWRIGWSDPWVVETERGSVLTGAMPSGPRRRRQLQLDDAATRALLADVVARVEELTGQTGWNLTLAPVALTVRLDRAGAPKRLTATLRLLAADGGKQAGKLTLRLKR